MKSKKESGEVVVEASIVVTLVVIFISIMLYIGMVLYQKSVISVVANRTATNISQVYSNTFRDPFTGYLDFDNAYNQITYRNIETDAYLDAIKQKGTAFAQYRLKKAQIIPTLDRQVSVQVVSKPAEILKGQIVVTITDKYEVPLAGFFGLDGELSFTATGRADCVDYLLYLFGVEAVADPENSPITPIPESDTCLVTFFKDKYTDSFHAAVPVLRGKTIITSNRYSHSTMPRNPELNGMQFTGWVTSDGRNFSASVQVDDDMSIYGTWECSITFDPTGGAVTPTTKTAVYKQPTELPIPTKHGFQFMGWYSDVEYSQEYGSNNGTGTLYVSEVTEMPGNIVLYAKWECLHTEFTHSQLESGDCQTRSTWLHECTTCDYSYTDRGDYGFCEKGEQKTNISPSCTTTGWYVSNCKFCDRFMESGYIDALGHKYAANGNDYDEQYSRAATCYREGVSGSRCSRCGAEKGTVLPKTGHNLGEKVITNRATCVDKEHGYRRCQNSGCGYEEEYDGEYGGHNFNGRCGTTHTLKTPENDVCSCINAHEGDFNPLIEIDACKDKHLQKFQCVVCCWCGEFEIKDEDTAVNGVSKTKKRTLSDGRVLQSSTKVWCWDHHPQFEELIEETELKYEHKYN